MCLLRKLTDCGERSGLLRKRKFDGLVYVVVAVGTMDCRFKIKKADATRCGIGLQ